MPCLKRIDVVHWTADPRFHGLLYDVADQPFIGELRDVSEHEGAGCNVALISDITLVESGGRDEQPFWYLVLQPMPDQPCDQEFLEGISS